MQRHSLSRVIVELGIKAYPAYDAETIERISHDALKFWSNTIEEAPETSVLLWVGDGDEVFNWRGRLADRINYCRTFGFNNQKYDAYPASRHYDAWPATPYTDDPPELTYADLKAVIAALRAQARALFAREITVGTIIDAGPEFVESAFKFERHPELLEGGPGSRLPKSLAFLNCYAAMRADDYPYAEFPDGVPEGTSFGEFLGRQLRSMCGALGFDYCWFSNGLGLTHYAWSYLGEVYDGRAWDVAAAPAIIERFVGFWRAFRKACPDLPLELRGTNYTIGLDASAHGVDIREIYREGKVALPAPNPPWGSAHLELEIASHMSRIAWTPSRRILFRFYINDNWFTANPWWDRYNREPYDIYCPLSVARVNGDGTVEGPTDLSLMTVNTGLGKLDRTEGIEITPHFKRALDYAPDMPGPLVWIYPFDEVQDDAQEGSPRLRQDFFQDWFVTRCIAGGLPLNTVIHTGAFCELMQCKPERLAESVLFAPVRSGGAEYLTRLLDFVRSGGQAIVYGSLQDAPSALREALNIRIDDPIAGRLAVRADFPGDELCQPAPERPLIHRAEISGGGVHETLADPDDPDTREWVSVSTGGAERAYCLLRAPRRWQGGQLGWIRGSLPFEAKPVSMEPIFDDPADALDAGIWARDLLGEMGISIRQSRQEVRTPPVFLFVHRHDGAYVFSGHKPDTTASVSLRFAQGAPILDERETRIREGRAAYFLDKSFNFHCRAFVAQAAETLVRHKALHLRPGQHQAFRIEGLRDARVTLYAHPEFARARKVSVRWVNVYSVPDPTAEQELKKRGKAADQPERELDYSLAETTGAITVGNVTGAIEVTW